MRLEIERIGGEILLRPPAEESNLRDEGGVLVYYGRLTGDAEETIQQVREQRHRQITVGKARKRYLTLGAQFCALVAQAIGRGET